MIIIVGCTGSWLTLNVIPICRRIVQRDFDLDARTTFDDHLEAPARGLSGPKEVKHASDGNGAEKLKSDLHAFAGDLKHAEKGKKVSKKVKDDSDADN